jgi:hypothetical protein
MLKMYCGVVVALVERHAREARQRERLDHHPHLNRRREAHLARLEHDQANGRSAAISALMIPEQVDLRRLRNVGAKPDQRIRCWISKCG